MPNTASTSTICGPKIRFNTKVLGATFDDGTDLWHIDTDAGDRITARFLINAGGVLTTPKLPDIDGVDSFAGLTMHTARWDHSQDLTGKRVAIIGTGASAVQVIPEIAPIVKHLTVFQRTPIWCFPKPDVPLSPAARRVMRIPGGKAVQRLLSQAYVELTFPLAAQYFTVNPMAKRAPKFAQGLSPQTRSRTPSCATSSRRATRWGASGPVSTTLICRRSTATTSAWSPSRSTRSPARGLPPPTARPTRSTC